MSWAVAISIVMLLISLLACWFTFCVNKTSRIMSGICEDIMRLDQFQQIEKRRIALMFSELNSVEYNSLLWKLVYSKNPAVLFGPALQMLRLRGIGRGIGRGISGIGDQRWWDIYEKIYTYKFSQNSQRTIREIMANGYGLEQAMGAMRIPVDQYLYPDRENIKQAMADACAEYDEAMAAQEIMDA